jgi:hypothetical protein
MARAFLSFVAQVQSLAHTHVGSGSSPIVGPFFLAKLLAFPFSPSPIECTGSFSFALRNFSRLDIAPLKPSIAPLIATHQQPWNSPAPLYYLQHLF